MFSNAKRTQDNLFSVPVFQIDSFPKFNAISIFCHQNYSWHPEHTYRRKHLQVGEQMDAITYKW